MKIGVALCSVALPALWAHAATAQVSIPLPQSTGARPASTDQQPATEASPPTSIPLPTGPTDGPQTPPSPGPDASPPGTPIGAHGRPDINPYERDIDMTVPLTFLDRNLGDIPVRLTADDRFLLDTEVFLRLLKPVVTSEALAELTTHLQGMDQFGPDNLAETGIALTYDPSLLAVVVLEVAPDQRAMIDLFGPVMDDPSDVTLQPAAFSAYLNISAVTTRIWGSDRTARPTINLDGATRIGRFVFEGYGQFGERGIPGGGNSYSFQRSYARMVFDEPEDYRRWFLGDLDIEVRGRQSYAQMGGIGILRQKRRFNAFRAAVLQANRQLILQRESTVRFLRNGTLYREMRLQPGRYDFSTLPLVSGSNDIQIQVTDNSGAVQDLSYQQYLDPIDLDPGDYEYGAFLGPASRRFSYAPDYKGPVAFTGFFRKAFLNAPAIGIGVQASEAVQMLTGQTQFVISNAGRVLVDAAGSRSKSAGTGYAGGIGYEHYFDRSGLTDSLSIRADYTSPHFAALGNEDGINNTAVTASAQYTRQFDLRLITTATASYIKGRRGQGDSYRIGATGYYRLNRRWTFRTGVDYMKFPSSFSRGSGWNFTVGLTFQPDYRRRAEARYESRDNRGELSYNQSGLNQMGSLGFGGVLSRQDGNAQATGYAAYSANRFDASVSHATYGRNLSNVTDVNATTLRVGTTIALADGIVGIGRRINDSFMLLRPHQNLGSRKVVVGQSIANNDYTASSGALGAAMHNFLGSYMVQSVQYDIQDPPPGYDTGSGVYRVNPPYKSGYAARIGTDAFASVIGTLQFASGTPVSLIGGRVTLLDVKDGESPKPVPFFTNSVGRFAISNMLPDRRYLVEVYGPNGAIAKAFEFTVPADTNGLVDLGIVRPGSSK